MTDQYVGEIRAIGFSFAPRGWAFCNGQLLPIAQNTALFSLLGVNYGGNGTTNFGLPNLQGRFPVHANNGSGASGVSPVNVGEAGGSSSVTLTNSTMAGHGHTPQAVSAGGSVNSPTGAVWAEARFGRVLDQLYAPSGGTAPMHVQATGLTGGGLPHNNMPPYLAIYFIIALEGIFPARN